MSTYTYHVPVVLIVTVNAGHEEEACEEAVNELHSLAVYLDGEVDAGVSGVSVLRTDNRNFLTATLTDVSPEEL